MAIYNSKRHDFGIVDVGSVGAGTDLIGFMLDETREGVPAYFELDASLLADQFYTGQASVINIDPKKKIILSQADWRAGFGLEIYDANDPTRYRKSTMDMSNRGMGICGQKFTAIANDATNVPTIVNADMEIDGGATPLTGGWDYSNARVVRSSTQKQAPDYSLKITTGSIIGTITSGQYIKGWTPGVQYTISIYTYGYSADHPAAFYVTDGTQTETSTNNEGQSWVQKSVQITVASNATYLRLNLRQVPTDATERPVYFDTASITMDDSTGAIADGVSRAFAEYNDDFYTTYDKRLAVLNSTGTRFLTMWQFGANITDLEPFTDDKLYIALGWSTAYEELGTNFSVDGMTANTLADNTMKYMTTVFTTADTMYGSDSKNTIRSTTNPADGGTAWSSTTTVGAGYHDITKLIGTFAGALYIMKQDKPYYLDSSGNVQQDLAPELVSDTKSTSGKNAHVYLGRIYIPAGDQTLLETDGTPANNVNRDPASYATNLSDYVGRVQALASDGRWLFAIVDNSGSVEVLKGRNEVIGGTTSWVWHPIGTLTLTDCETAFVSTVFKKRLWITSTATGESISYMPLPTKYGDVVNDANRNFLTGTLFETPLLHGNFKADNKAWLKLTLTMGHTYNVGRYFTVKYKELGGSFVSVAGNFAGSSTSMVDSKVIDTTNKPFSTMLGLQFTAVTDDTNETPMLLSYEVEALPYFKIQRLIYCVFNVADNVKNNEGGHEGNMYERWKSTLDNARSNAVWPVTIKDIDGTEIKVMFLPVPESVQRLLITKKTKNRKQERQYHALMLEIKDA